MNIYNLDDNNIYEKYLDADSNGREINIYKLDNCRLVGDNLFYPNCLISENDKIYNPVNEIIMSLKNVENKNTSFKISDSESKVEDPAFYFIYNTDNYYHFIYDTLPYLITFKYLRKRINNLKLLMNYPNFQSDRFYPFVKEILEILEITDDDIIIADGSIYSQIYISSSYTHGDDSNKPPREEIYSLYKEIVENIKQNNKIKKVYPKKIYISRRTWLHNDFSNIGTNYTQRRKMVNEDELVEYLVSMGYEEVFTEKLSTIDKILLFSDVESVVAPIGGGSCNVLFSNKNCNHICIVSPTFLDVNYRFIYSLDKVNTKYFNETSHTDIGEFKKYMRVTNGVIVGEVEEVYEDTVDVIYTNKFISGWNSEMSYEKINLKKSELRKLDDGLNSPFSVDVYSIKNIIS